jgi:aspartyl-tRNA synthetase
VQNLFPEKKIQQIPFPRITYKDQWRNMGQTGPILERIKKIRIYWLSAGLLTSHFLRRRMMINGHLLIIHFLQQKKFAENLIAKKDISGILTTQYDVALNGFEIGGGSIRNHRPEALEKVFEIMGYKKDQIQEQFGHMLQAFKFGAPPHGGMPGFERLLAILRNEPNIREVIAFPKTGDGRDFMMQAPSELIRSS